MENVEKIKASVEELLKDAQYGIKSLTKLKNWKGLTNILTNIKTFSETVIKLVFSIQVAAENIKKEYNVIVSGPEKREAAIEILDDYIKLPWYLEIFDKALIGVFVSLVVETINFIQGKDWDSDAIKKSVLENIKYCELDI